MTRSGDAQLARNPWIDEMQLAMGQPGKHGRQVHLFLNGSYHGIYHIHEHPDEDFMASYYPGPREDFHFPAVRQPVATTVAAITGVWPGAVSNLASIIILRRSAGSISQIFVTTWCSVFMPGMTGIGRLSITGRQPAPLGRSRWLEILSAGF